MLMNAILSPFRYVNARLDFTRRKYCGWGRFFDLNVWKPFTLFLTAMLTLSASCYLVVLTTMGRPLDTRDITLPTKEIVNSMAPALEAIADFDRKNPTISDAERHVRHAKIYSDHKIYSEARRQFELLRISDGKRYQHAYEDAMGVAENLIEEGKIEEGKKFFEQLLVDFPKNWTVRHRYACILAHSKHADARDPDKAIELVTTTFDLNRGIETSVIQDHLVLADAHAAKGNFDEALSIINKMMNTYANDPHALAILKGRRKLFVKNDVFVARHL